MNRNHRLLALAATCALLALPAAAQYAGPGADTPASPVAALRADQADHRAVHLFGYLVRQVGPEAYLFSDGQQQILAEIDDRRFPAGPVGIYTPVELRGKLERHGDREPRIDVRSIRVVD